MGKIKLAVIGLNVGRVHARNVLSDKVDADLVAVSDIKETYADFAKEVGAEFYTDYKEMLRKERPDGVIVAVPPQLHRDIGIYCAGNGVNILMEKPITGTLEDADKLIEAVEKSGVKMLVGHQHRFDPGVELAREKLRSKQVGKLIGFHIFGVYSKIPGYYKDEWRLKRATAGGPLNSNGIHDIDRIRYVCGEIEAVGAFMANAYRGSEVEDTVAVSVKCANGVVGTYYITDCGYPATEYTDSYFASGATLRFNCSSFYLASEGHLFEQVSMDEASSDYYGREKRISRLQLPTQDNHRVEIEHFVKVIKGLEEPKITGRDAKRSLQVLQAIIESAEKQKEVYL